ncbi:ArsR/SmtB family transcription factor [Paenibacillus glycanilyticus]|uniref:Transcriptional regulator n=1 Tax=Paenibacillus glycanilyticus TaxID=126569 RepID=A0ABQ6G4U4_9BACL|nr:metalloregulator ArsR/SmtB family transcription factor [Paenibacillus glycanilyticus]GLX65964.1 transcriptional regulator [Paenibacillus glycanilyticus]
MDNNFKAYDDAAEMLKALAHPVRLCIVKGLLQKGRCNVSFMQDCLDLPQSTVSQHLQKLRSAGIVAAERSGLEIHYTIASPKIAKLIQAMFSEDLPIQQ